MHKIIVIDDAFGCNAYLALYQLITSKGLYLNSFSIENVLEKFKAL